MAKRKDMAGLQFGRLTIIAYSHNGKGGRAHWLCRCECGREKITCGKSLRNGLVASCGCLHKEFLATGKSGRKHGSSFTKTYKSWSGMRDRCLNKNNKNYAYYGARGICISERWSVFNNFYDDMGERPTGKSIDRINNEGDYSPENCRWSTPKEQANNRRRRGQV